MNEISNQPSSDEGLPMATDEPVVVTHELKPPRRVGMGRAGSWIYAGFSVFNLGMGTSVGVLLLAMSIQIAGNLLPGANLLLSLFSLVFAAGFMAIAHGGHTRGRLSFTDYFAGFRQNMGELVLAAAIYLGLFLAIFLVVTLLALCLGGWEIFKLHAALNFEGPMSGSEGLFLLFWVLVALLFVIPLMMMVVYAPPLILFHDLKAWPAMKLSMVACWKNMLPLLWYGVLVLLLSLLGLLMLAVGLLVVIPVINYASYFAYRDIFLYDDGSLSA